MPEQENVRNENQVHPPPQIASSVSSFAIACLLVIGFAQVAVAQAPPGVPIMYAWSTASLAYPTPVHVGNCPYTVQDNGTINDGQTLTSLGISGGIYGLPNPSIYTPAVYLYQLSGLSANAWHTFTVVNQILLKNGNIYSVYWGGSARGTGNPMQFGACKPGLDGQPLPTCAGPYYTP